MAPATSVGLKTAVYHCPINASSDPTPVKPPSQKTQYITQVPESPSVSQRSRAGAASQSHPDDFVQDSLENHPPAPPAPHRQPSTFLDFLKQSGPTENTQTANATCDQVSIASCRASHDQIIDQGSIEGFSPKHLSSENHITEEDSVQVPPPAHIPFQDITADIAVTTQARTSSQRQAITEDLTQTHIPVQIEPEGNDYNEEIEDCIVVRSRPATPPVGPNTRKGTNSSADVSSASQRIEDIYGATPVNHTGFSCPDVSATTGFTTPSMPPKTSTTKGTTSASQSQKATSTSSKKSSKHAPPLPDIVNQGETSSTSVLQKMRAGGTSQANTTRQALEGMPRVVAGTETSQKSSTRPVQAPATKSSQRRQGRPPAPSTTEPSHGAELPAGRGEFDLSPDPVAATRSAAPWRPEEGKAKPTKTTKPTSVSLPQSKKSSKSQPKRKAAKASESSGDDKDEEYSAPKSYKSRTAFTTRASTRAQTQTITKDRGINISARTVTASNVTPDRMPVSRKTASSHRGEEIEDFEDSVTHINSGGAASPQLTTLSQPAKPRATKPTKTRRMTEREAQLMHDAISSPDQ